METFPMSEFGFGSAKALHAMIEAKKLAYADMAKYVADPRGQKIPVATLLSKEWAKQRAKSIDSGAREVRCGRGGFAGRQRYNVFERGGPRGKHGLADSEQLRRVWIGIVAPGTGFALHNRGGLFTLESGSPNALAGHKRRGTRSFLDLRRRARHGWRLGLWAGGISRRRTRNLLQTIADFKMNIQAALEAPRFSKHTFCGMRRDDGEPVFGSGAQ